jgi:hypothetical protein
MWPLKINPYAVRAVSIFTKSSPVGEYSLPAQHQVRHTRTVWERRWPIVCASGYRSYSSAGHWPGKKNPAGVDGQVRSFT